MMPAFHYSTLDMTVAIARGGHPCWLSMSNFQRRLLIECKYMSLLCDPLRSSSLACCSHLDCPPTACCTQSTPTTVQASSLAGG